MFNTHVYSSVRGSLNKLVDTSMGILGHHRHDSRRRTETTRASHVNRTWFAGVVASSGRTYKVTKKYIYMTDKALYENKFAERKMNAPNPEAEPESTHMTGSVLLLYNTSPLPPLSLARIFHIYIYSFLRYIYIQQKTGTDMRWRLAKQI